MNEKDRLESIAGDSLYTTNCNIATIEYSFRVFEKFLKGQSILELGPAEGIMTEKLINLSFSLHVVEGSSNFCKILRNKFPSLVIHNKLFEEYIPSQKYDNIVLGHVLEHVDDPVEILSLVKSWLNPGGLVLCAVPNSQSIHRQAAVKMGLLEHTKSMSILDKHHGHRRVYDYTQLKNDFLTAKLQIVESGGYWLKPISNQQLEEHWTTEMLHAFLELGEEYPEIAAEIYIIATTT